MAKILGIWGAGGLGREVLELAEIINIREHRWDKYIFIVDGVTNREVSGVEVFEYVEAKGEFGSELEVVVGIGEPVIREDKFKLLNEDGVTTPTLIHPDIHIPETTDIGKGVVIQYGCFVSCGVKISDHVYIQPLAAIGHDDVVGKNCIISSYASLAGNVHIGDNTYVAPGTIIKESIRIGTFSIIGLGSIVHRDIPDGVIALGNPARPMKNNDTKKVFGR